jgi:hypothetical protein
MLLLLLLGEELLSIWVSDAEEDNVELPCKMSP